MVGGDFQKSLQLFVAYGYCVFEDDVCVDPYPSGILDGRPNYAYDSLRCRTLPDPTRKPNLDLGTRSSLGFFFFFFESFRIIQIQLLFQTHFKYSMKIYIRKYHFNIKGTHHLITKLFFLFDVAFHAHLVNFPHLYNAALIAVFNIKIFAKHNQSSIFIIVFVQNELNNFMYACDGALLILRVTLTMTLIHCGLHLRICSLGPAR